MGGCCCCPTKVQFGFPIADTVKWFHQLLRAVSQRNWTEYQIREGVREYARVLRAASPRNTHRQLHHDPDVTTTEQGECSLLQTFIACVHKLSPAHFGRRGQLAPGTFGFNLDAMVLRQVETARKMSRAFPQETLEAATVKRLVYRYKKFLLLSKKYPTTLVVPTLGIDLIWHAHMMHATKYAATTTALRGGALLDHSDEVGDTSLEKSRSTTRALWNKEYGGGYDGHAGAIAVAAPLVVAGCGAAACDCGHGACAANCADGGAGDAGCGGGDGGCGGGCGGGGCGGGCGGGGCGGGGCGG
eukprot:Rhum_TRINITY_DN10800_c0_g1::Rhum_TRINITY_DN10800_c0_g1_i1::g.40426::m.40426